MVTIFLKDLCERYIPFYFYLSLLYLFIYSYVLIEFKSMNTCRTYQYVLDVLIGCVSRWPGRGLTSSLVYVQCSSDVVVLSISDCLDSVTVAGCAVSVEAAG